MENVVIMKNTSHRKRGKDKLGLIMICHKEWRKFENELLVNKNESNLMLASLKEEIKAFRNSIKNSQNMHQIIYDVRGDNQQKTYDNVNGNKKENDITLDLFLDPIEGLDQFEGNESIIDQNVSCGVSEINGIMNTEFTRIHQNNNALPAENILDSNCFFECSSNDFSIDEEQLNEEEIELMTFY
ncbi:hypothetical protein TRFO_04559 [Tritrichomonas foetus]|uniref:Uncharacterized protein n=1 Tax=Tritrichomonas foetus TaxID=1144522 RepID=A0A1J4KI29_9EUKA|nr:hypothetical protein TRFO_04559 [Tritrichomonas foetus]|eukprot:OHT09476.1 hypothetical protein TRFO_04559 [Tritrichomonas foetus]